MTETVINLSTLPPSTNNLFPGSKRRYPSKEYTTWRTQAGWELLQQHPKAVKGRVALLFQFEEPTTKHRKDVTNLIKAPEDLLVAHGIIEADDQRFVRRVTEEWCSDVKGVRITITGLVPVINP